MMHSMCAELQSINYTIKDEKLPSIAELASSPTIGHDLRVVYMQILIG